MGTNTNIGIIIKNMRLQNNLSQEELGKKINLAPNTISSYERGNSQPDFNTIIKIFEICNYNLLLKDKNNNLININDMSKEKY